MLPRSHRITDGADYRAVMRQGARCGGTVTVTYLLSARSEGPPRFGVIVSRRVGKAVVRNRVRRRISAACADMLPRVRPGTDVVVRALPAASDAEYARLHADLARCLERTRA